jgi:hypothetical protein
MNRNGSVAIIILFIVVIVLVVGGIWYYETHLGQQQTVQTPSPAIATNSPTQQTVPSNIEAPRAMMTVPVGTSSFEVALFADNEVSTTTTWCGSENNDVEYDGTYQLASILNNKTIATTTAGSFSFDTYFGTASNDYMWVATTSDATFIIIPQYMDCADTSADDYIFSINKNGIISKVNANGPNGEDNGSLAVYDPEFFGQEGQSIVIKGYENATVGEGYTDFYTFNGKNLIFSKEEIANNTSTPTSDGQQETYTSSALGLSFKYWQDGTVLINESGTLLTIAYSNDPSDPQASIEMFRKPSTQTFTQAVANLLTQPIWNDSVRPISSSSEYFPAAFNQEMIAFTNSTDTQEGVDGDGYFAYNSNYPDRFYHYDFGNGFSLSVADPQSTDGGDWTDTIQLLNFN